MCTVSYIGDDFNKRAPMQYPNIIPNIGTAGFVVMPGPSREEFERLKAEVAELKELLKAAKRYDDATGQPDCEQTDKIALLRKIAEFVGVDLSEVFPPHDA